MRLSTQDSVATENESPNIYIWHIKKSPTAAATKEKTAIRTHAEYCK